MLKTLRNWLTDYTTYTGLLYFFLNFPISVFYFALLIGGLAAGITLTLIGIGIPILVVTLLTARLTATMDGLTARMMLNANVDTRPNYDTYFNPHREGGLFSALFSALREGDNWRAVLYLLLKFPLAVATFVITMVSIMIPLAFIGMPIYYNNPDSTVEFGQVVIDTLPEALGMSLLGVLLLVITLAIIRGMVVGWRKYTEVMLRRADEDTANREKKKKQAFNGATDRLATAQYTAAASQQTDTTRRRTNRN